YRPDSVSGQKLLAHELTHAVQQGAATVQRSANARTGYIQRVSVDSNSLDDWNNLASGSTSTGVTGVIFATGRDGSQIVVKGLAEAPHRAMLAQELMEQMGIGTTRTRPVAVNSKLGQ